MARIRSVPAVPTPESADNYVDFNFGLFAGEYKYVVGATSSVNAVKSEFTELPKLLYGWAK